MGKVNKFSHTYLALEKSIASVALWCSVDKTTIVATISKDMTSIQTVVLFSTEWRSTLTPSWLHRKVNHVNPGIQKNLECS